MMTNKEFKNMVAELAMEEKAVKVVPHFYKRNGKMIERKKPDMIYSDRYYELKNQIEEAKNELKKEAREVANSLSQYKIIRDIHFDKMEKVIEKYGVSEETTAFIEMMKVAVPAEMACNINWVYDRLMEA